MKDKASAGLFFEMGLGKTLVILEKLKQTRAFPAIIICPLSVVSVWEREAKKFGYDFRFKKLTGSFHDRIEALNADADVYVINFEGVRIIPEQLKAKGFKTLIADESHRLKDPGAKQTKVVLDLSNLIPNRFILSGTPVTKSPEDLWPQIEILQPSALGNFWNFRARYINFKAITVRSPGGLRSIKKPVSFKNLAELEGKVNPLCLRKTKKECLELPEKIYKRIDCELSDEQRKKYSQLKHSLAVMLSDEKTMNVSHAATLVQKLRQICQGFVYDEAKNPIFCKENGKLKFLQDLLKDIAGEKVIVFAWFKAEIDLLQQELSKTHRVILYQGDADERGRLEKEFQECEDPVIFLAQIETAKEGITLTAAHHVVYFSNSWSYSTRKQSEDRAHRAGQTEPVVYYDFIAPNTVDELVHDALTLKGAMADKITGDSVRLAQMLVDNKSDKYH